MTGSDEKTDQITKYLLQKATVQKPPDRFTSSLMKMIEQEKTVAEGSPLELPERQDGPLGTFIFSGICMALLGFLFFLISRGALSDTAFGRDVMNMLSALPVDSLRIIYLTVQEYYFIPAVINLTCLLIIIDLFLRKKLSKKTEPHF